VTAAATPILEIDRLALSYSARGGVVHAVQDASLVVANGESVGIAGESGSGKSTLARAVLGLLPERVARITNGRIVVAGRDVTHLEGDAWRSIRGNPVAIVFQDPLSFLNPVLRVGAQIAESVRRHDPAADLSARCVELLRLVRLEPAVLRRYPHELSGGRPRLLIADEPTTALDVTTQAEILALLRELRRTLDMSLLVISHDLGLLRWNCDRVYVMYAGHAVESGPTEAVMTRPAHPYTQGLIAASRLHREDDGHFATVGGDVPGLHRRFTHCPFAPRCPHVMEICRRAMPPFLKSGEGAQEARCWLLDPSVASEDGHACP
jgi:oligopeptide/dipeptide ABC transporter ATP-binding protein